MTAVARALAPAKLNLTLEVLGHREDGFHNLESVVVHLDLADELTLTTASKHDTKRDITYRDDSGRPVPILSQDIVARVWDRLLALDRERGWDLVPPGGRLDVRKRIPVAAGLGGGSADAAAFLRLARRAWSLPLDDAALCAVGAEIGSDIPACIVGGPLQMSGRGELVKQIEAQNTASNRWVALLAAPEIPVPADKTAAMYRSLRPTHFKDDSATTRLAERLAVGQSPTQDDCVNSFDAVADETLQGLRPARRAFAAAIARAAIERGAEPSSPLLAGAGPSLFVLLPPEVAEAAANALRGEWRGTLHVARPLSREAATQVSV